MNINYRNARDELKHRISIDKKLETIDIGGSVVITDYSIYDPRQLLYRRCVLVFYPVQKD